MQFDLGIKVPLCHFIRRAGQLAQGGADDPRHIPGHQNYQSHDSQTDPGLVHGIAVIVLGHQGGDALLLGLHAVDIDAGANKDICARNQADIAEFGLDARAGFFKGVLHKAAAVLGRFHEFLDEKRSVGVFEAAAILAVQRLVDGHVDTHAVGGIGEIIAFAVGEKALVIGKLFNNGVLFFLVRDVFEAVGQILRLHLHRALYPVFVFLAQGFGDLRHGDIIENPL